MLLIYQKDAQQKIENLPFCNPEPQIFLSLEQVMAPTGSGKTNVALMTILREVEKRGRSGKH